MRRHLRATAILAVALGAVLTLASCTPATFIWGYVGQGADLRLAFCSSSTATFARVTVFERPDGYLEEVQSAVWSGPRIVIPSGAIFAANDLPEGWQTTNDLDLSGDWDRIDIDLYDGGNVVETAIFNHRDSRPDGWSLSPAPGLFAGTVSCHSPIEHAFVEQPDSRPRSDVADAREVAMADGEFWTMVEQYGSIESLTGALSMLPDDQLVAFHARLMVTYFELDTAAVWNEYERQLRVTFESGSRSTASFVDFRSDIILGGEQSTESALAGESFPELSSFTAWPGLEGTAGTAAVAAGYSNISESIHLVPGTGANSDGW